MIKKDPFFKLKNSIQAGLDKLEEKDARQPVIILPSKAKVTLKPEAEIKEFCLRPADMSIPEGDELIMNMVLGVVDKVGNKPATADNVYLLNKTDFDALGKEIGKVIGRLFPNKVINLNKNARQLRTIKTK